MTEYDYIIVGAGTAGCVLAARLSEDAGARVLLPEAGGAERTRAMAVPDAWPELLGSAADWGDVTTAQADAGAVAYPRGRALGGSGAINAMGHVRGHRAVYDGWAAGGAAGWGFADLLPYFLRTERADGRDPALRGTAGPVRVGPVPEAARHPAAAAFATGLAGIGYPVTDDLSGARQEGVAWVGLAVADGQRVSPADAYLRPVMGRPNLTVETGCLATRLRTADGRCTGVGYLQDHPIVMASYATAAPLGRSAYNHGEMYAALRSPLARTHPDLHLFPILLPLAPAGCQPPATGFALVAAVVAPDSRGSVRLDETNSVHPTGLTLRCSGADPLSRRP